MKVLDYFSYPISLSYKKKNTYATEFGGYVSLVVILLLMSSIFYFGRDIYLRSSPTISIQESSGDVPANVSVNFQNSILALNFSQSFDNFKNLLDLQVMYYTENSNRPGMGSLERCSEIYNLETLNSSLINYSELEYAYCLPNLNYTINGGTDRQRKAIIIQINPCTNNSQNNNSCLSLDEQENLTNLLSFTFYYFDNQVKPFDYLSPIQKIKKTYINFVDYKMATEYDFFYKQVTVNTDDGVIFEESKIKKDIMLDRVELKQSISMRLLNPMGNLLSIVIQMENLDMTFKRTYLKFQNVFANVGGIMKIFMVAGRIIVNIFGVKLFHIDLINTFFEYDSILNNEIRAEEAELNGVKLKEEMVMTFDKFKNCDNTSQSKEFPTPSSKLNKDIRSNTSFTRQSIKTVNLKKVESKSLEFIKNRKKTTLKYSICQVIKSFICLNRFLSSDLKIKDKLLKIYSLEIMEKLDLNSLVKHFRDIDFIKSVTLDDYHIMILDLITKYKIGNLREKKAGDENMKYIKLVEFYNAKKLRNDLPTVDQKLLLYIEKHLGNFIRNES